MDKLFSKILVFTLRSLIDAGLVFQDLPHTVNMLQRGIRVRTVEDLINMRLDSIASGSSKSKIWMKFVSSKLCCFTRGSSYLAGR